MGWSPQTSSKQGSGSLLILKCSVQALALLAERSKGPWALSGAHEQIHCQAKDPAQTVVPQQHHTESRNPCRSRDSTSSSGYSIISGFCRNLFRSTMVVITKIQPIHPRSGTRNKPRLLPLFMSTSTSRCYQDGLNIPR